MTSKAAYAAAEHIRAKRQKEERPSQEGGQPTYIVQPGGGSGSFKSYIVWGLIGTASVGVVGYFGYKFIHNVISNQAAKDSLEPGEPSYYAQQIKMGFENDNWPGTNTNQIRQTFVAVPDKQTFRKVSDNYHKRYGGSMFADLQQHLKSTEMQEMIAIYRIKPEKAGKNSQPIYDPYAWAERINAAVNFETWGLFWGTDMEALKQVIREIPNQNAWDDTADAYQSKYSTSIVSDIDSDVSSWDFDFRQELTKKGITVYEEA